MRRPIRYSRRAKLRPNRRQARLNKKARPKNRLQPTSKPRTTAIRNQKMSSRLLFHLNPHLLHQRSQNHQNKKRVTKEVKRQKIVMQKPKVNLRNKNPRRKRHRHLPSRQLVTTTRRSLCSVGLKRTRTATAATCSCRTSSSTKPF